jgi:hypothetical protein
MRGDGESSIKLREHSYMNENTEAGISITATIFVFIAAATFALWALVSQEQSVKNMQQLHANEDHRLFNSIQEAGKEVYSGAQVIYSIFQIKNLNADIQVGNLIYSKNLTIENTDVSSIDLDKKFNVTYERNTDGELVKIIFN